MFLLDIKTELLSETVKIKMQNIINKVPKWKTAYRDLVNMQKIELYQLQRESLHDKIK